MIAEELNRGAVGRSGILLAGSTGARVIFVGSTAVVLTKGSDGSMSSVRTPSVSWAGGSGRIPVQS